MRLCSQCRRLAPTKAAVCPHDGATLDDVATLPAGAKIAGYEVVRLLGEGGMGFVYEAVHEVLRRRTAMKFLRPEYASEAEVVTRFTQEAQAVNLVNHENIVNVYDIGDAPDGSAYFVMEYLEGKDLSDVQAGRPLPLPLLVHIYAQVLRALLAAHAKQIVHRDLKPANVFITKREGNPYFVKLLDFGIAKLRDGASKALTREGAVMGTPSYMSPEQIQGKPVDHRSDLFTMGTMLYRAATGVTPFKADGFAALATEILGKEPTPIRQVSPTANLPASLERLIQKAMRKRVDDRYQSAAEMLLDLETVRRDAGLADDALDAAVAELAGIPVEDRPARSAPATRASLGESMPVYQGVPDAIAVAPPARRSSRRAMLVGGAALGVVGLVAVGLVLMRGDQSSAAPAKGSAAAAAAPDGAAAEVTFVALRAANDPAAVRARAEAQLTAALDGDAAAQGQVVAALALIGSPRAAPLLYRALAAGPDVRVRAARALRELGLPDAAPKLRAALDGSGDKVRVELAASMAVLGDADADPVLTAALADEATGLIAAAALAEAGRGEPARATLTAIYGATPRGRDRWRIAAEALARIGDDAARGALIEELAQPDGKRAVAAAEALARIGDDAGHAYLARVVADTSFVARPAAAFALARAGDASALGFVEGGLASPDADTRMTAIAVIARLGAQAASHLDAIATLADRDPDPRVRVVAEAALWTAER